jgi:hypothetical protein
MQVTWSMALRDVYHSKVRTMWGWGREQPSKKSRPRAKDEGRELKEGSKPRGQGH